VGISIENIDANRFNVCFDGNTLYITAVQSIGNINVYSITGARVAEMESDANIAQINLSSLPNGAYIVHVGANKVKIIK
jgi:hypothetical protein